MYVYGWIILLLKEVISLEQLKAALRIIARFQQELYGMTGIPTSLLVAGPNETGHTRPEAFASVILPPSINLSAEEIRKLEEMSTRYATAMQPFLLVSIPANLLHGDIPVSDFKFCSQFEQKSDLESGRCIDRMHQGDIDPSEHGFPNDLVGQTMEFTLGNIDIETTVESLWIHDGRLGLAIEPVLADNWLVTSLCTDDPSTGWYVYGIHTDDTGKKICYPRECGKVQTLRFP